MTTKEPEERDWDAEFSDITSRLGLSEPSQKPLPEHHWEDELRAGGMQAAPSDPHSWLASLTERLDEARSDERDSRTPEQSAPAGPGGQPSVGSDRASGSSSLPSSEPLDLDDLLEGGGHPTGGEMLSETDGSPTTGVPGFKDQWRLADETPHIDPAAAAHPELAPRLSAPTQADEDTFIPPEPQGLADEDPSAVVMVILLAGGILWLLYLALFDRYAASLWWFLACACVFIGFAMAVVRQPQSREDKDDPFDDGARL